MASSYAPSSTAFSQRAKDAIFSYQDGCWVCGPTLYHDAAHVISQHDTAVRLPGLLLRMILTQKFFLQRTLLQRRGLLNFDIAGVENGVALCPTCHRAFDDLGNPGIVFLPTDLAYFICFEENDQQRRARDGSARLCPTAEQYYTHQMGNSTIGTTSTGGLYNVYILTEISALWTEETTRRVTSLPRPWHGEPLAAIRRGIHALGSLNISRIPTEVAAQLRRLQDLYQAEPQGAQTHPSHPPPPPSGPPPPPKRGGKRDGKRSSLFEKARPSMLFRRNQGEASKDVSSGKGGIGYAYERTRQWVFGPDSTSESAMKMYQRG